LNSGADDYLPKPSDPEELLARAMDLRSLEFDITKLAMRSAPVSSIINIVDTFYHLSVVD